ncbi:hypothetical protein FSP39_005824 [Pinctada imbricata]|uniref:Uncharacterized protein n=1 Tax=Pinctada imbricata TaxID=66713 RepID=A0AA88XMK7_PINIB|nr:hypothetical protein FSP39_005824 [Pinctada imbricata]
MMLSRITTPSANGVADGRPKSATIAHWSRWFMCGHLVDYLESALHRLQDTADKQKSEIEHQKSEIEQQKFEIGKQKDINAIQQEEIKSLNKLCDRPDIPTKIMDKAIRSVEDNIQDTVAVLARSVGAETFAPIAKECAEFALNLLNTVDDPDLRRCVYGLFGALSTIMKQEISPYLETVVTHMMGSLKSTEGIKTYLQEEKDQVTIFNEEDFDDICDEEDLTEDDDEEDEAVKVIVENAFEDEKEDTCCALGELAENSGAAFYPYLELSFTEVIDKVDYPKPDVKKAAIVAVGQMCICVHKANQEAPTTQTQTALMNFISAVMVKLLQVMKEDIDRLVVMAAIDTTFEMLNKIGLPVIQVEGVKDAILTRMKEAFTHKLSCQDADSEEEEDEEAEFDGMLIESAGDVLPAMAKLMGGEAFLPFFTSFLVDLVKRLKVTSSVAEKSFAVGTIADIIKECGVVSLAFVNSLYPLFMKYIQDEEDEVRSNAVFGLGVLVANSGDKMHGYPYHDYKLESNYTEILKCLFGLLSKEKNGRVMDNTCAAICRMISTHKAGVPLEMAIPIIIQCLPLKEDFEENPTVYNCLIQLYTNGEQEVLKNMIKLLSSIASVLGTDQVKDDLQSTLIHFVKDVHQKFPSELETLKTSMSEEHFCKLTSCLTMTNGTS